MKRALSVNRTAQHFNWPSSRIWCLFFRKFAIRENRPEPISHRLRPPFEKYKINAHETTVFSSLLVIFLEHKLIKSHYSINRWKAWGILPAREIKNVEKGFWLMHQDDTPRNVMSTSCGTNWQNARQYAVFTLNCSHSIDNNNDEVNKYESIYDSCVFESASKCLAPRHCGNN